MKINSENTSQLFGLPIFVDLSTSLDGIFLLRSVRAVSMFSLLWCGNSNVDLWRRMSSITTTLCKKSSGRKGKVSLTYETAMLCAIVWGLAAYP